LKSSNVESIEVIEVFVVSVLEANVLHEEINQYGATLGDDDEKPLLLVKHDGDMDRDNGSDKWTSIESGFDPYAIQADIAEAAATIDDANFKYSNSIHLTSLFL
jgi:hypothetical protein